MVQDIAVVVLKALGYVTGSDKFGEEKHIVASPACKEQLFEEQRGHLTSESGRALEVQNFRALNVIRNRYP